MGSVLATQTEKNSYTIPLIWILWLGLGWRNQNSPPICRPFTGESVERVRMVRTWVGRNWHTSPNLTSTICVRAGDGRAMFCPCRDIKSTLEVGEGVQPYFFARFENFWREYRPRQAKKGVPIKKKIELQPESTRIPTLSPSPKLGTNRPIVETPPPPTGYQQ